MKKIMILVFVVLGAGFALLAPRILLRESRPTDSAMTPPSTPDAPTVESVSTLAPLVESAPVPVESEEQLQPVDYSVSDDLVPSGLERIFPARQIDTWDDAFAAIAGIPSDLGESELFELWDYISNPIPADMSEGRRAMEAGIRNDLMGVLLRQQPYPFETTERMIALSRQEIGDEVIQAYITQHLSVAYERDPAADRRASIRERLWEIADHMESDDGGTALIALTRLSPASAADERARLANHAREWLESPDVPPRNRVSLLHVLGQCGTAADIPVIERHEADAANTVVRLAAQFSLQQLIPEKENQPE